MVKHGMVKTSKPGHQTNNRRSGDCRYPATGIYSGAWEMTMRGGKIHYEPVQIINPSDESWRSCDFTEDMYDESGSFD